MSCHMAPWPLSSHTPPQVHGNRPRTPMVHMRKRRVSSLPSVCTEFRSKSDVRVRHDTVPPARFSQVAAGGLPEATRGREGPCGEAHVAVCRLLTSNWQQITMPHRRQPIPPFGSTVGTSLSAKCRRYFGRGIWRPQLPGNRGVRVLFPELSGFISVSRILESRAIRLFGLLSPNEETLGAVGSAREPDHWRLASLGNSERAYQPYVPGENPTTTRSTMMADPRHVAGFQARPT